MLLTLLTTSLILLASPTTALHPHLPHTLHPRGLPGAVYLCKSLAWNTKGSRECEWHAPPKSTPPACQAIGIAQNGKTEQVQMQFIGPDEGGVCEVYTGKSCEAKTWFAVTTFPGWAGEWWKGVWSVKCYVPQAWKKGDRMAIPGFAAVGSGGDMTGGGQAKGKKGIATLCMSGGSGECVGVAANECKSAPVGRDLKKVAVVGGAVCQLFMGTLCEAQPESWVATVTGNGTQVQWKGVRSAKCFISTA